ncbi:DUF1127 domain-containing protein [Lichenihabitans psoromatis]|uniref:DUF1127 domain-containing protein n=1 Tax=Lichenihabitans psoromatis TaxID=2528642 RepID=UPI0010362BD9|nr:DUF1127 domain-containing protein [Lichenihabitans psoromatis]
MSDTTSSPFRFRNAFKALRAILERRRVVGQLSSLDDYMLRDIGITRFDVASVLAEPLYRDPSKRLAERAHETRRAHRAISRETRVMMPPAGVTRRAA